MLAFSCYLFPLWQLKQTSLSKNIHFVPSLAIEQEGAAAICLVILFIASSSQGRFNFWCKLLLCFSARLVPFLLQDTAQY